MYLTNGICTNTGFRLARARVSINTDITRASTSWHRNHGLGLTRVSAFLPC